MKRTCASCGGEDHLRKSSKKCKFYDPIQGEEAPHSEDAAYKYEYAGSETVVKMSLKSVLKSSTLHDKINHEVKQWTLRLHGASLAFRYFVLTANTYPALNDKFFYGLLALFVGCGNNSNVEIARIVHDHFRAFILPSKNQGQQLVYFSRTMKQNLDAHLEKCKRIALARTTRLSLQNIGIEDAKIGGVIRQMFCLVEGIDCVADVDTSFEGFENIVDRFQEAYLREDPWDVLEYLKSALEVFAANGGRVFHLTPLFGLSAKHITIDTRILFYLTKPSMNQQEFERCKLDSWKKCFDIPSKYFPKDYKKPISGKKYFTGLLRTDGVSCSLVMKHWFRCLVNKEEKKAKNKSESKNAFEEYCVSLPQTNLVGVDPGRKDVFTYVCSNGSRGSLGNSQCYHESHFKKHLFQKKKMCPSLDYPTLKSTNPQTLLNYVAFLLPHLSSLMDTYQCKKWKKMRFDAYVMKKRCLDKAIKQMVEKSGSLNPVVGFGNASFNHASKGHAASPRRLWAVNRMKKIHRLHVLSINEFNTSQVCWKCKTIDGVDGLKKHVSKSHFVRQCNNTECRAIWNRDINASLNMMYLLRLLLNNEERPELFRTSLKKLREQRASGSLGN